MRRHAPLPVLAALAHLTFDTSLLLGASSLLGCGQAEQGPYFDDQRFLQFGVDPRVEAEAIVAQLARAGLRVTDRVEGTHHVAIGLADEQRQRAAIRVVTSRGTVLSLDNDPSSDPRVPPHGQPPRTYVLLTPQRLRGVRALPDNEIFVGVTGERSQGMCVAGFRVSTEGALTRIPIDAAAVAIDSCAAEIEDTDRDGNVELIVHADYAWLLPESPPMIRVALMPQGGAYRWVGGVEPGASLLRSQEFAAREELAKARRSLSVTDALRAAVALAAIARFQGATTSDQMRTFDTAMRGVVLSGPQAARIEQVRRVVRQGWQQSQATVDRDTAIDPGTVLEPNAAIEQPDTEQAAPASP